jgi:nitrite reductase/ring-hydroxylating ferredoxin subunit
MDNCQPAKAQVTAVPAGITRRAALTAFAAALASVGLTSLSESAYAAAKTYNICKTTDVRPGSARMFSIGGRSIVVTQPKRGVFRAFAAECTHQGCRDDLPRARRKVRHNFWCRQRWPNFNRARQNQTHCFWHAGASLVLAALARV